MPLLVHTATETTYTIGKYRVSVTYHDDTDCWDYNLWDDIEAERCFFGWETTRPLALRAVEKCVLVLLAEDQE